MDKEKLAYIEEFGEFFEGFGVGRMLGRVLGVLLVPGPPERTAEELAGIVKARDRGSISAATRSLVQLGVVGRRSRLGDRKAYFRSTPEWTESMWGQVSASAAFRRLAERGLELTDGASPESRLDLEEMRSLYANLEREMPRVVKERGREEKAP